jgi:hypothetical protein
MKEIDDAVARGPFRLKKEPDDYTGMVQLRIKDRKVIKSLIIATYISVMIADFRAFRCI